MKVIESILFIDLSSGCGHLTVLLPFLPLIGPLPAIGPTARSTPTRQIKRAKSGQGQDKTYRAREEKQIKTDQKAKSGATLDLVDLVDLVDLLDLIFYFSVRRSTVFLPATAGSNATQGCPASPKAATATRGSISKHHR